VYSRHHCLLRPVFLGSLVPESTASTAFHPQRIPHEPLRCPSRSARHPALAGEPWTLLYRLPLAMMIGVATTCS
jgi:hypothetical protein